MTVPQFTVQQCAVCGHSMFPARLGCSRCGSGDLRLVPAGPGVVIDIVTILRSPNQSAGEVPVVALVELAGGPRVLAGASDGLRPGMHVDLTCTDNGIRVRKTGSYSLWSARRGNRRIRRLEAIHFRFTAVSCCSVLTPPLSRLGIRDVNHRGKGLQIYLRFSASRYSSGSMPLSRSL
jgi:uncharacterized OB-fold protein